MSTRLDLDGITRFMARTLDSNRYLHTLGVLQTAVVLAALHGVDAEKAATAALLHDCAKPLDEHQLRQVLASDSQYVEPDDLEFPWVLHAPAAAVVARQKLGVEDCEVLEAVAFHPTGLANPSAVLQVLMAADYTEPTRRFPGVDELRRLVRADLAQGVRVILAQKLEHVRATGRPVHARTAAALQSIR
jgi:predicted HD superfamily hydrolase involved in NAD metabolism